ETGEVVVPVREGEPAFELRVPEIHPGAGRRLDVVGVVHESDPDHAPGDALVVLTLEVVVHVGDGRHIRRVERLPHVIDVARGGGASWRRRRRGATRRQEGERRRGRYAERRGPLEELTTAVAAAVEDLEFPFVGCHENASPACFW